MTASQRPPVREGDLLFEPSAERVSSSEMSRFISFLARYGVIDPSDYEELWAWSIRDLEGFWLAIARFFDVRWSTPPTKLLVRGNGAEGARWFAGARLNYADQVTRHAAGNVAVIAVDEASNRTEMTYGELIASAGAVAAGLRQLGVRQGDRVAAVLPNSLASVIGFLACASLGAIWSSCAPEFGAASMVDRFRQIEPRVLLAASSYRYGGRDFDLSGKLATLEEALPGLVATVVVPAGWPTGSAPRRPGPAEPRRLQPPRRVGWDSLAAAEARFDPVQVAFDHPLWILYSSGTTGLPKPIVHGHGGILLEHLKAVGLHSDLSPADRFFWFSTTGWMMWNFLLGGLLVGSTIICYDGSPVHPDPMVLWRMAADIGVTFFGTSAPFIEMCRKAGLSPRLELDLSGVRSVGSTGAPLPPEGFEWATFEIADDVAVGSVSGGTDVCTAFLHACPLLPVYAGELQCAALGAAVQAFDPDGRPLVGQVGELVVTEPMVSMPVSLWGDESGNRLHQSYFADFNGVWRHGDWVKRTERGTFVVYGRSDATLNRGGVRMGTAEFYRVVEALDGVADSLVIDTSELGREGELLLLVVPVEGESAESLAEPIRDELRRQLSPRHVPDRILGVAALPRTLNGKKVEVPLRRVLLGASPDDVVSRDSLAEPDALDAVLDVLRAAGMVSRDGSGGTG
ncbi:MAG: acetoacetate--CoA ligase [Actinomycetota bacterium]|nr:acetoacetate--CoA ligase [Actinomycetota bacterium]